MRETDSDVPKLRGPHVDQSCQHLGRVRRSCCVAWREGEAEVTGADCAKRCRKKLGLVSLWHNESRGLTLLGLGRLAPESAGL
jgi:hypothetical protein